MLDINYVLSRAQISKDMKVADLGCGASGHFTFPAARLVGKHGKIYAVDILKTILETINRRVKQENIKNIETIWSNLEIFKATKIESGSLDVAMLLNTLYQSRQRAEILREAIRMLKKGGKLIIVEWKNISSPFGPSKEDQVKAELLKANAQKLGLEIESEFDAGQYHYGIIFIKI